MVLLKSEPELLVGVVPRGFGVLSSVSVTVTLTAGCGVFGAGLTSTGFSNVEGQV